MEIFFLIVSFVLSIILFLIYKKICIKFNIIDLPTLSNVHKRIIPTGAGLVFYIVFLLSFLTISIIYNTSVDFFFYRKIYLF